LTAWRHPVGGLPLQPLRIATGLDQLGDRVLVVRQAPAARHHSTPGRADAAGVKLELAPEAQASALGLPGQSGDAEAIAHLAARWNSIYVDLMQWAARLRGASTPSECHAAMDALAAIVDSPMSPTVHSSTGLRCSCKVCRND